MLGHDGASDADQHEPADDFPMLARQRAKHAPDHDADRHHGKGRYAESGRSLKKAAPMTRATRWTDEKIKSLKLPTGSSEKRSLVDPGLYLRLRQRTEGLAKHWQYLVTVLGMGGAGKTRLVRRYGWTCLGDWPGGVYFCDLCEARSAGGIAFAVAAALGVPLGAGDPIVELGRVIAGRGKCLIVLDNFEQVNAHAASTLNPWLQRANDASFVVTSREVLAVPGDHVIPLEPLATDGAAVDLFAVRERSRRPEFELTASNRPIVQDIVMLLDGLPLAIELAAARVVSLAPRQLLERLKDRFQLLAGVRGVQARQATLRSAIDWSWALLAPWEQSALGQASVFVGGFTVGAAESVLDLALAAGTVGERGLAVAGGEKPAAGLDAGTDKRVAIDELYFGMYVSIQ